MAKVGGATNVNFTFAAFQRRKRHEFKKTFQSGKKTSGGASWRWDSKGERGTPPLIYTKQLGAIKTGFGVS